MSGYTVYNSGATPRLNNNSGFPRSAREFWATGDGTTDDYKALLDAANTLGVNGTLYFPAGTYRVGTNLTLSCACIFGPNAALEPDSGVTVTLAGPVSILPGESIVASGAQGTVSITGAVSASGMVIDVKAFGAVGDGVADDTDALNRAGEVQRITRGTVIIPPGDYIISNNVTFRGSVECQGRIILTGNNNAKVIVGRSQSSVSVSTSGLGGFTRGSTQLTGLTGYGGYTLLISSTEDAIKIFNTAGTYKKKEVVRVVSDSGEIQPPLDETYDSLGTVTLTAYPPEEPALIRGLRVYGQEVGTTNSLVLVQRDDAIIDALQIDVPTAEQATAYIGLDIRNCVHVTVRSPWIRGVAESSVGYGIQADTTADTYILDGDITECRHPVGAGYARNLRIIGGRYRSSTVATVLDNHWGDLYVEGAVLEGGVTTCGGAIGAAGGTMVMRNCTVSNCQSLAILREDTPELRGPLIVENNTITYPSGSFISLAGMISIGNAYGSFFGRALTMPPVVRIANNVCDNTANVATFLVFRGFTDTCDRVATRLWLVENNAVIGTFPSAFVPAGHLTVRGSVDSSVDPRIVIRNQRFSNASVDTLHIKGDSPDSETYKYVVELDNCDIVSWRARVDVCRSVTIRNSRLRELRGLDAGPQTPSYVLRMVGCRLGSTTGDQFRIYESSPLLEFVDCVFETSMAYATDAGVYANHTNRLTCTALSWSNVALSGIALSNLPPMGRYASTATYASVTDVMLSDGMTAPGAVTGHGRIYIDTADGDLKIVFADGTIKTIVTDT